MDNFSPILVAAPLPFGVEHFGRLLFELRNARGLTQMQLAERAGVTETTIRRAEKKPKPSFFKSTATDVLRALENITPLSNEEIEKYLRLTGLTAIARIGRELAEEYERGKLRLATDSNPAEHADPNEQTAFTWLERLMDEAGHVKVLTMLETMAGAWGIDLPPRLRADEFPKRGQWAYIHPPKRMENREVTRIDPITPPVNRVNKPVHRKAQ